MMTRKVIMLMKKVERHRVMKANKAMKNMVGWGRLMW